MNVLVTGGAGFVGANVAVGLSELRPDWHVIAFDNLHRRGSALNLPRLRAAGVQFVHGDVRARSDLDEVGHVDCVVECSAEAAVVAGLESGLDYLVATNLLGAHNCLTVARANRASFMFMSTSRVYPVEPLRSLRLDELDTRSVTGERYTIYGYGGKQVRDNVHSADLISAFAAFHDSPRPAAVYNIGGGRHSNCSVLEAIEICERIAGRELDWSLDQTPRIGDHRWWISDLDSFRADYPRRTPTRNVEEILAEIYEHNVERWSAVA